MYYNMYVQLQKDVVLSDMMFLLHIFRALDGSSNDKCGNISFFQFFFIKEQYLY